MAKQTNTADGKRLAKLTAPAPIANSISYESSFAHTEFLKLQLEQISETYRMHYSQTMQLVATVIIANVTIVGFALSTQIASALLIGACCPPLIGVILRVAGRRISPIIYSAVSLESKYGIDNVDWLATILLAHDISPEHVGRLRAISLRPNLSDRVLQLHKLRMPFSHSISVSILLTLIMLGQVVATIILVSNFSWRLF